MTLLNTKKNFGVLNKLIHWSIAAVGIFQFIMIYYRWQLHKGSLKLSLILWHKQNGVFVLFLTLLLIVLRISYGRPNYLIRSKLLHTTLPGML